MKRVWKKGEVISSEVRPETVQKSVTKFVKVSVVTRTPEGRLATILMRLEAGVVEIEIDEATARALAKVFD